MKIKATNKATGEVIELIADSPEQVVEAWRIAQEYEKAAKALKDQLKNFVPILIGTSGVSEPIGNYQFRLSNVQRMNYDKAVLRETLDPDTFDILVKPDKPAVDKYLKENLEALGEAGSVIRQSMVPEGQPYQVIKLEKLSRDAN